MSEDELVAAILNRTADRMLDSELRRRRFYGTASRAAVESAEREMGLALPNLLTRLYLEVANGGFGDFSVLGVEGGYTDPDDHTISSQYNLYLSNGWIGGILPIVGSEYYDLLCIDRRTTDDRLLVMKEGILTRTDYNLSWWLEAWVSRVDFISELFEIHRFTVPDPITDKPIEGVTYGRAKGVVIATLSPDASKLIPTP
jgi:hypothetical protein